MNNSKQKNNYFKYRNISEITYKKYNLPKYLLNVLQGDFNLNILGIGCGFGQMLLALKEYGYKNLSGIDISKEAVKSCKNNDLNVQLISNIQSFCSRYKGKKFDIILMSHVLEHLPKEDIIETISYIRNYLLAEDGRFIVMVPNAQSNTHAYWAYEDFTHNTLFTSGSIYYVLKLQVLKLLNFSIQKVQKVSIS